MRSVGEAIAQEGAGILKQISIFRRENFVNKWIYKKTTSFHFLGLLGYGASWG